MQTIVKITRHPSYRQLHTRVQNARGKAAEYLCEGLCGGKAADWATVHGKTGLDVLDYVPLCRKCHKDYDGHAEIMRAFMTGRQRDWHGRWVPLHA